MAQKVTYDLTSDPRLIIANSGITQLDVQIDLYSDGKEDWQSQLVPPGIVFPFRTVGGDPLTATKSKGPAFFLASGWAIKPFEGNHELQIEGDLFSDITPPDPLHVSVSGAFTVNIIFNRNFDAIVVNAGGPSVTDDGSAAGGADNVRGPQFVWDLNTGQIPLLFDLQYNNVRVSGSIPTVEVYRDVDDFVLDWVGNIFVASPSGIEHQDPMTELVANPGLYRRRFDPTDFGQTNDNQIYYMVYRGVVPSGFNGAPAQVDVVRSEVHKFSVPSGISSGGGVTGMTATFVDC